MCASSLAKDGLAVERALRQHFGVGADLDRVAGEAAFERRSRAIEHAASYPRAVLVGIAQEESVRRRPDRARTCGAGGSRRSSRSRGCLVQHHVDQRVQESGIGLRLDRHPFGRAGAGDRQVRLDLHALHAAVARIGVAPHADHAARGLRVGAAGNHVIAHRRVGRHGEARGARIRRTDARSGCISRPGPSRSPCRPGPRPRGTRGRCPCRTAACRRRRSSPRRAGSRIRRAGRFA